jgi:hypothetical protein
MHKSPFSIRHTGVVFLLIFFGLNFTLVARAGVISSTTSPVASGPGLGLVIVPGIVTANPNNDNQVGGELTDNNLVIPLKRFDHNDYIDLLFTVTPSDGVTEYKVTEFVDNNTGINWSSYKMQLGSGTGTSFVAATSGALDFDAPSYDAAPSSPALPTVATSPFELTFSGGSQGTGASPYTFRLDVPDLARVGGPATFTLRQIPRPIPEPGTFAIAALGLIGLVARRWSR